MIREAMAWIADQVTPTLFKFDKDEDDDKRIYTDRGLSPIKDPSPADLKIHTLGGLCDWIDADSAHVVMDDVILIVESHARVIVTSCLREKWAQRDHYLTCTPAQRDGFPFEQWLTIEQFIIAFQCGFVESANKARVIKAVSSIKGSTVATSEDDGLAQKIAVENEVQRLEETTLEPMIALQPFRTFTEVTQPESLFLLRLKAAKDDLPRVALFEADGGAWKNTAITNIADFLKKNKIVKARGCSVLS
jgi:hypothetical protein